MNQLVQVLKTSKFDTTKKATHYWNSICAWGPTAMLPIFHILGTHWIDINITSLMLDKIPTFDLFYKNKFYLQKCCCFIKSG